MPAIQFSINDAEIVNMRADKSATFRVLDPLPRIVYQSGGTCGIYALDRALDVRGIAHAPPRKQYMDSNNEFQSFKSLSAAERMALTRRHQYPITSMRQQAKEQGLSKVGEILSISQLLELSASCGAKDAQIVRLDSATDLWNTVADAVRAKRAVIIAINGDADYDAVLDGPTTMGHWITLIGTYEKGTRRCILSTQVGRYDLFPLFRLWRSNDSLRKWRASKFDLLELHEVVDPRLPPKVWKNLIEVGDPESEAIAQQQNTLHLTQPQDFPHFSRRRKVEFKEENLIIGMRRQCLLV